MSTRTFHWDALEWLRHHGGLATEVRPDDRVDDVLAPHVIPGFAVRPSRAGAYAFAALWVVTLGLLLTMVGMPQLSDAAEAAINRAGQAALVAGAGLMLAAWVTSRRNRSAALVQIVPAPGKVTVESLAALHGQAHGRVVWVVSERPPGADVLAAAARLGVRCMGRTAEGFATVQAPHAEAAPHAEGALHAEAAP